MSRLTVNAKQAEISRGCVFAETFENATKVSLNGGVITASPFINRKATFNGSTDKITYRTIKNVKSISFWVILTSTTEDIMELSSSHSIEVVSGTITATGINTPTIYVNGVATDSIGTTKAHVTITTATAFDADSFVLGYDDSFGDFVIEDLKLWNVTLTAQEVLDYANNSTFTYMNEAILNLPFLMGQHDATNVKTLDKSGKQHDATFGDGSTSTTYPTKSTKKGYSLDGGDYFKITDHTDFVLTSGYTISVLFRSTTTSTNRELVNQWSAVGAGNSSWETLLVSTNYLRMGCHDGTSSSLLVDTTSPIRASEINHAVFVYDGGTTGTNAHIYLNGKVIKEGTINKTPQDSTNYFVMIGADTAFFNKLTGNIYDVKIWNNRKLTPIQVRDLNINLMKQINEV